MARRLIRLPNALPRLRRIIEEYKAAIYQYNSMIRGTGYYLKPVHIVTKKTATGKRTYTYIGRYWWRVEYVGKKGKTSRIRWIYIGRSKPPELKDYPDPPRHPLEGLRVIVEGNDVLVEEEVLRRYRDILSRLMEEE